jgi:hypothetical protein
MTCEGGEAAFIQFNGMQPMPIKPAVQISKKPQFVPGVDPAVPLFEKELSKPVDVTRQWATSKTLDCSWVLEEPCHHTSIRAALVGWMLDYPNEITALQQ